MDRFPKITMIVDHLARAPYEDGPPYKAADPFWELAKYKQIFLKITPVNVSVKSWGKGDAGIVLRQGRQHLRRRARRLGLQLPELGRHHEGNLGRGPEGVLLRQGERPGLGLRQDRADALSVR